MKNTHHYRLHEQHLPLHVNSQFVNDILRGACIARNESLSLWHDIIGSPETFGARKTRRNIIIHAASCAFDAQDALERKICAVDARAFVAAIISWSRHHARVHMGM